MITWFNLIENYIFSQFLPVFRLLNTVYIIISHVKG